MKGKGTPLREEEEGVRFALLAPWRDGILVQNGLSAFAAMRVPVLLSKAMERDTHDSLRLSMPTTLCRGNV